MSYSFSLRNLLSEIPSLREIDCFLLDKKVFGPKLDDLLSKAGFVGTSSS